jgi:site-specific recombinase XerD
MVTPAVINRWLQAHPEYNPRKRCRHYAVIRQFCLYLVRVNAKTYVPNRFEFKLKSSFAPHIYSHGEIESMMNMAAALKPDYCLPMRPHMFRFLIVLLYTTGMRIGEAFNLKLGDIDWQNGTLSVRNTKFYKSRLVPLSDSMVEELRRFLALRQQTGASTESQAALFQNPHSRRVYSRAPFYRMFYSIIKRLGYTIQRGGSPRIHDLRHTFAVHRLESWYANNEDVQTKLPLLSTYLGHKELSSTQWYLTMTPELLRQASQRFNSYFDSIPGGPK